MLSVLILGAGLSGVIAGNELQKSGHRVTLLEKDKEVGGRLATQCFSEFPGACFDTGAQFLTVRGDELKTALRGWKTGGIAELWFEGFPSINAPRPDDNYSRYKGVEGMGGLARHLAQRLDIRLNQEVVSLQYQENSWMVRCRSGGCYHAEKLLLTAPLPQSVALLDAGAVVLPEQFRAQLESVRYEPCIAVMALLDGPSNIPAPGALHLNGDAVSWVADNFQKGLSRREGAVTIHSTGAFARAHYEEPQDWVAQRLIEAASDYLGTKVLEYQLRRWRYARPENPLDVGALGVEELNLVLAGDGLCGAKMEGAFLSGLAAANLLKT